MASRSLIERARLRREADETDARKAAATFGVFQSLNALISVCLLVLCGLLLLFSCGSVDRIVWVGAVVVGSASLCVALLGCCLNRFHTRDAHHAARTV